MAFSNPELEAHAIKAFTDYVDRFHSTKMIPDGLEYVYNTIEKKQEVFLLNTPLATWTRIAKWCKEQNLTVEQLADSLEKQE